MNRKVIILDGAKPDFREIRKYVLSTFGEVVWSEVNQEFKNTISSIGLNPEAGKSIENLKDLGVINFRLRLVRQTRIVYEYDEKQVLIHMFIHTKKDFRSHLMKRLFSR
jgi:toxin ParE1/3/4